ncbi:MULTISPECIES: NAD-dependent epimerase/dehydratase family protein [Dactylosporangium]|uniref:Epimerase n=2 Tax=Dactylosporangium TaxID=35753 RepID=A0A9W6NNS6_9ACTN|nr:MULTISPECIES: NAD-dependent epimerase/dehydratase family protein [Dactylosporangium]UAB96573.1 GDP-mannose 4,6-dehydratase [Dactylosporangium vinaceum]UWZ44896.1 GDP-mannose 4,6-dehydratase [Dactylosporangium matsuzakiense]GLL03626.1 epimerase [Dactylosporangium matsuzakiense]
MVVAQRYGAGHRVLLTGGAGFVGSHLADALVARGAEVVVVDNFLTGSKDNVAHLRDNPLFTLVEADVTEPLPAVEALAGRFDAIMHFASPASPTDFEALPVEILRVGSVATLQLLERAVADGARFIMASTSEAYGDPLVHPQPETYWGNVNPIGVRSVYDEAKRFSEAAVMGYHRGRGADVGIVRIFNTYGERMRPDDGRAIPTFISQALRGEPITVHGTGTQTRSITYVSDLVRGILLLLDSGETGPVNCGTTHEMTMLELAETIVRICDSSSRVALIARTADDPERRRPDLTKARELLGYEPLVGPQEGLARTVEYFRGR